MPPREGEDNILIRRRMRAQVAVARGTGAFPGATARRSGTGTGWGESPRGRETLCTPGTVPVTWAQSSAIGPDPSTQEKPMKRAIPAVLLLLVAALAARAEEGMWPPDQLPQLGDDLRALGMRIDPRKLSDLTQHPMNAVISLGGCTASFVSPEGLVITNHHCAYGAIQYNSTEERNLLEEGFLARDRDEELFAGPGSRVLVTVEVTDVTDRVLADLALALGGRARYQAIEDREKELVATCEEDEGHRCRVAAFHGGLQYSLIKQLEIRDVRLVYAPAEAIGKFGGDIDNWMWPRHTGDFSFYRAYVGPDGKPADHDEANVPFRPRHHLKVSVRGLGDGDFVMVAGYPGNTNRYRLADEVKNRIAWDYPTRKAAYEDWLEIIDAKTADRPEAAIKYAGLIAGLNNVIKNYQGMLDGFAKSDIIERKKGQEADLQVWLAQGGEVREQYLSAMTDLRDLVARDNATRERQLYYDYMARRGELLRTARTLYRLSWEGQKPDTEREPGYQDRDIIRIRERLTQIDRRFDPDVDRAFWRSFIVRYASIPVDQHVAAFDEWFGIEGNRLDERSLDKRLGKMYERTQLRELDARLAWMSRSPDEFENSNDPFIQLAVKVFPSDIELEDEEKDLAGRFKEVRPRYMAAMIAWLDSQGKPIYPDANGTLRVTYGTVRSYVPRDGIIYTPFTTLEGVVQKETGEAPFASPEPLLAAVAEHRYGRYEDPRIGSVPVNFLSTLDTTGGNSGSPTLNADAELVGLLFDGNYEAINADWDFNPAITRSIHVDIRYVLWVMEEIDGVHRLMQEMGIPAEHATSR